MPLAYFFVQQQQRSLPPLHPSAPLGPYFRPAISDAAVIVLSASPVSSQLHLSTVHRQTKLIAFRFALCLFVRSTTTVTTSFHSVLVCSQSISWCLTQRCCMSPSARCCRRCLRHLLCPLVCSSYPHLHLHLCLVVTATFATYRPRFFDLSFPCLPSAQRVLPRASHRPILSYNVRRHLHRSHRF